MDEDDEPTTCISCAKRIAKGGVYCKDCTPNGTNGWGDK